MSGGIKNVTVRNHTVVNAGMGLWIKSMRNRGGAVEDILFDGITMNGIGLQLANIDMFYTCGVVTTHVCNATATPAVRNVRFQNIVARNVKLGKGEQALFWLRGLPESSLDGISVWARRGRLSGLSFLLYKSVSYGVFVRARRALNSPKTAVPGPGRSRTSPRWASSLWPRRSSPPTRASPRMASL
jgi:hypothetical protein